MRRGLRISHQRWHQRAQRGPVFPGIDPVPVLGFGRQGQRQLRPHRHFDDDARELRHSGTAPRRFGNAKRTAQQCSRQIAFGQRGAVDPGREPWVPFEQPQAPIRVTQQFDLGAARPAQRAHRELDCGEHVGRHAADAPGPGLALGGDDALAHGDRVGHAAIDGGERDQLLVAVHVCLHGQLVGAPPIAHPGTRTLERAPRRHENRLVIGALQPHAPGMAPAKGIDHFIGFAEIE